MVDGYSLESNELYWDRDPAAFTTVLNFYRTGRLHTQDEVASYLLLFSCAAVFLSVHVCETILD